MTTLHTYADLLHDGGRLAATAWPAVCAPAAVDAVTATLKLDPEAIVLAVADHHGHRVAIGHAPGGLAA